MTYKVVTNKPGNKVVLRIYANTELSIANLQSNNSETVTAAHVTQIFYGADSAASGSITMHRANTSSSNNLILRVPAGTSDYVDMTGAGLKMDHDLRTANIIFTLPANTHMVAEFKKESNYSTS